MLAAPHLRVPALAVLALAALALPATASAKKTTSIKLPAKFAARYHVKSVKADPDKDGLTNYTESLAHTSPKRADSDHDGTKDGAEDYDGDKLTNLTEQRAGTNAGKRDSDRDGIGDGREDDDHDGLKNLAEQQTGNDPGNRDSDADGTADGRENAGRIVSYSGGALTLLLSSTGKTVTAPVTGETDVECNMASDYTAAVPVDTSASDDDPSYDDGDGPSLDDADPSYDDDPGADSSDDGSDDPTADASRLLPGAHAVVHAADDGAGDLSDDPFSDDGSADAPDVPDTSDPCVAQGLVAGAWVHESEISAGDDGDPATFDEVALVADLG